MTDHAPDRIWSGIDIPKTIAGVLAALSAAVLGSFLGVAGTIAGAAVASLVGSVGTEIYHRWIDRSHKKIKQTFVTAPAAMGTPPVAAAEDESPSEEPPADDQAPAPRTPVRWRRVAAVAAAVFVLAMGALTAFELFAHRTVADAVGNSSSSSTTFGSVFSGNDSSTEDPQPAPSGSASETAGTEPTTAPDATEPTAPATDGTQPADPGSTTEPADPGTTQTPAPAGETNNPDAATLPDGENPPADGSR